MARTTMSAWVTGSGSTWGTENPFHLPLIAEERPLTVGDSTSVVFNSPFDRAEAWITMEREHVLEQRRITVKRGANVVSFHIGLQDVPNVFVSVLLVRRTPGAVARPHSTAQLLRVGFVELTVGTAAKRLAVAVNPQSTEYRPGDTAVVRLVVHDSAGHGVRSEVTLWAVDQGVLALTGFQTPDALELLYQPRGLGARLVSTLPSVLTGELLNIQGRAMRLEESVVSGLATSRFASDSVAAAPAGAITTATLRSRFRSTAFFLASIVTDDSGRAIARARLPDNLTTYRVMAVAVSADDRYGRGDSTFLVTRPLVARPTLPRFVRASD
ncbi:MAG: alpha-2-macroglobulin family protein, partial [Gemmatimonadaceae bacterium]